MSKNVTCSAGMITAETSNNTTVSILLESMTTIEQFSDFVRIYIVCSEGSACWDLPDDMGRLRDYIVTERTKWIESGGSTKYHEIGARN